MFTNSLLDLEQLKEVPECRSLFSHPLWLRTVKDGVGYEPVGVLTEQDGRRVALQIYYRTARGPFRIIGSPLPGGFTPYFSTIYFEPGREPEQAALLKSQFDFLRRRGYALIEWWFYERSEQLAELARLTGGRARSKSTYVLAVEEDREAMWKKLESRARNMVRKAEKEGVVARRLSGTPEEVSQFYGMLETVFAKRGLNPPHPIAFYQALARNLGPQGRLLFLSAELNGRPLAMGLFPHDDHEIHYLSGASLPEGNKLAANNLVQWETIKYAAERRLKLYNLGGRGIASIDKFKASFGGVVHDYYGIAWRSPLARAVETGFLAAKPLLDLVKHKLSRGGREHDQ